MTTQERRDRFATGDGECPFCGEDGVDFVGLRAHFMWCEVFNLSKSELEQINGGCADAMLAAEPTQKEKP